MSQIHLPEEIIYKILELIINTETILNCRLVCRKWYEYFNEVNLYRDYELSGYYTFSDNKFQLISSTGIKLKELIFYKYGKTIYKEYKNDGYVKKIIKIDPPFKTMVHDYSNNDFVENIYYNFDNKSNSKSYTPIITNVNCIIM